MQHATFTGSNGELTINTDTKVAQVHDGVTPGGFPLDYTLNVKRFGAKGDGMTDDTAPIQAAINAMVAKGSTLVFPEGDYRITSGLTISSAYLDRIRGFGRTSITWGGSADASAKMITITGSYGLEIDHIQLRSNVSAVGTAIWFKVDGRGSTLTECKLTRVQIDGVSGKIGTCVKIGGSASADANNDFHQFENCIFTNYSFAGVWIASSQAYNIGLRFTKCVANSVGDYGVYAEFGSFNAYGGGFAGNNVSDVYLGTPNGSPINIEAFNSESSRRLLVTGGPSSAQYVIVLKNGRWSGDRIHPDLKAIDIKCAGNVLVDGCRIGGTPCDQVNLVLMDANNAPDKTTFCIENSIIHSNAPDIFSDQRPTTVLNSFQISGAAPDIRKIPQFITDHLALRNGVAIKSLPEHANNAAARDAGLDLGELYRNGDTVHVVHR